MALHFVSTSVLSSSDGIDFNSETQKETEESRAARLRAEAAAAKPLYMQLAEREDEKKQEYDAMTKKLFAPPKALDEEDAAHLSRLDEARDKTLKQREHAEKAALATFRSNRLQDISAKVSHPLIAIPAKKETHNVAPAAGNILFPLQCFPLSCDYSCH